MAPSTNEARGKIENSRRRKRKNRATKIHLVFNEDERKEYLTGFKKRKDERRQKARDELDIKLREEKRKRREEQRDMLKTVLLSQRSIPEVEHLVEPVTYDLPNHTVTISSITDVDFQGKDNYLVGPNKNESDEDSEENKPKPKESLTNEDKINFQGLQRNLKKAQMKKTKASKVVHSKQKIQQKKDRQQAKKKRSIVRKREKHKGGRR